MVSFTDQTAIKMVIVCSIALLVLHGNKLYLITELIKEYEHNVRILFLVMSSCSCYYFRPRSHSFFLLFMLPLLFSYLKFW